MFRMRKRSGFTIVELLIVIVVISILASISVAAYTGIQQRANNSQQLVTVENWQKALISASTLGATIPSSPTPLCLGTANDYPAQDGFASGECMNASGSGVNISVPYTSTNFSNWVGVTSVPSGKMPTQSVVISTSGSPVTYRARGLWLVGPVSFPGGTVQIAWLPQVSSQCGSGTPSSGLCLLVLNF